MLCTGVGRMARGIETFFSSAFDGLIQRPELDTTLVIGSGIAKNRQIKAFSLSRNGKTAALLGKVFHRNSYTIEQLSSIPSVAAIIKRIKPHIVFSSDANLAMRLAKLRHVIQVPYRYLFSNGAPLRGPFPWADAIHQVTPVYHDYAVADGDDPSRHFLVPYGFNISSIPPCRSLSTRFSARSRLGLPHDRPIVLSVGWISRVHKRMDYIVDEIAQLPPPRPLLVLIGHIDTDSQSIIYEAIQKLGRSGVIIKSVAPADVQFWYSAADVFVLGSLSEGFGRVYIEALSAGIPIFSHDYPVSRYVNGIHAIYADFTQVGALASSLQKYSHLFDVDLEAARERWHHAYRHYSWDILSKAYVDMFDRVMALPLR